jgi:hypothetical protein
LTLTVAAATPLPEGERFSFPDFRGAVLSISLAIAMLPALAAFASAGEYASPRGFSLQCPDGWIVASNDVADANRRELAADFPFLDSVDPNRTAAFLFNPANAGYAQRIGIDIVAGTVRASSENAKAALRQCQQAIDRLGGAESNASAELRQVADRATIWIRHDVRYPGQEEWLRQWQVLVPGKSRTLVVTCTALAADFGAAGPAFTGVLNSLRVEDRPGTLLSEMPALTKAVTLGAMLLCAVIILRIFRAFRRKSQRDGMPE